MPENSSNRSMAVLGALFLVALTFVTIFIKYRQARECRRQVVMLEEAAMDYQAAHDDELPLKLEHLVPQYLPALPKCPSSHKATYIVAPYDAGWVRCTEPHDQWLFWRRTR